MLLNAFQEWQTENTSCLGKGKEDESQTQNGKEKGFQLALYVLF